MKLKILLIITSFVFLLSNCKDNAEDPPKVKVQVTDSLVFSAAGTFTMNIDASDISATITIIGAGGGGAGGVKLNSGTNSTGGGGGGGAGEIKEFENELLVQNESYAIQVGAAGSGGAVGGNGLKGTNTNISLGGNILYAVKSGNGGASNNANSQIGGVGGIGTPSGTKGLNGESMDAFTLDAKAGGRGTGGDNQSGFGRGGNGGRGTGIENTLPIDAESGLAGQSGYVKIVWTGLR